MKQVYKPYWEWEDWVNGMWSRTDKDMLKEAIEFTGDYLRYGKAMGEVIKAWPNTMINSLTNPSINKRAFLGHCACCYSFGCPEYITREAWGHLTDEQRRLADNEAQTRIDKWTQERLYRTTLKSGNKDVIITAYQTKLQLK